MCINPFRVFKLRAQIKKVSKMRKGSIIFSFAIICIIMFNANLFGNDNFSLSLEVRQYRFNQDTSLVEVCYGILSNQQESVKLPNYLLELAISKNKTQIIKNIWQVQDQTSSFADSGKQHIIVDVLNYLLVPGIYDFKLTAKALDQQAFIDSVEIKEFRIRKIHADRIDISDIELAQSIKPADPSKKGRFYKNRFCVIPNALSYYDNENPDVYYYFEVYNLLRNFKGKYYQIKRMVLNGNGLPSPEVPIYIKKKRIRGGDDVEVGMFSIEGLTSGKYLLRFAIIDTNGTEIISSGCYFYVNNPEVAMTSRTNLPTEYQMRGSEIALLSPGEVEVMLEATKYLLPPSERRIIANLVQENAKRLYLFKYWKENDSDPETPVLESFRELINRVNYSNENFKEIKRVGWQTDRGRILITYGKPSEIQYYNNIPDYKDFQAWSYDNIENGVVFIFGVLGGYGDYKLLHSTKTGETHNVTWLDLLKISQGRTGIEDITSAGIGNESVREIFRRLNLELPRYLK